MKTREPLQGFIMAANHQVIHLALIFAEVIAMFYYADHACPFERNFGTSYFLLTHSWCFVSKMISIVLDRYDKDEWSKLFEISSVPVYFYSIFEAHFYELNSIISHTETCGNGHEINLLY